MGASIVDEKRPESWAIPRVALSEGRERLMERSCPTPGMRGGLGRTLLTAFLILTILPLAVIGGYATQQNRRHMEHEAASRLVAVAFLRGEALLRWVEANQVILMSSMNDLSAAGGPVPLESASPSDGMTYSRWWAMLIQRFPDLDGAAVLSPDLEMQWSRGSCRLLAANIASQGTVPLGSLMLAYSEVEQPDAAAVIARLSSGGLAMVCLPGEVVERVLETDLGVGETGRVRLVTQAKLWPSGDPTPAFADAVPSPYPLDADAATDLYQDADGEWVIGAYYPLPDFDGGILVEQSRGEVLSSTERIAGALIALVLAVALGTTVIAAIVIRQITRPVIDLTESALAMAAGDLDQHLTVRSRDEIGILTYVFNEMAAELVSLYDDLEAKVVERTKRLQQANYQIQRRALHLQASQEVSQTITSIRDPNALLEQVTDLIRNHFVYSSVAVYLVAPGGREACLQACSPTWAASRQHLTPEDGPAEALDRCAGEEQFITDSGTWLMRLRAGDGSVVGRAIRKGTSQIRSDTVTTGIPEPASDDPSETQWEAGLRVRVRSQVAVPLRIAALENDGTWSSSEPASEERIAGVIAVRTTAHEEVQRDELAVLEALANQVSIALENARAYEREQQAMAQLESAEAFKARFLTNISRDLMGPLNTILGFSRLLLKGIDGPLSQRQADDLERIHHDGQHLHVLINDILSISEIQAGLLALRLQAVDLKELLDGVMPTARALVRGKDIELGQEIPTDLPRLHADPGRLRQVLIHLFTNAAKFTEAGEIGVRAWAAEDEVYVSVSDTGIGIPVEDREHVWRRFEKGRGRQKGEQHLGSDGGRGIGLGLALCREFIQMHGGRIWVDSEVGVGSVFTFSVPIHQVGGEC